MSWETVWECLFVWVEYLFGWDAIGWLDGICFYDWMDWICMSLHFWEPLFWTLPPTWTQYVEAYGHPLKGPRKINIKYINDFWHWFETRLFVSMISSCSPPKTSAKMNRAHFDTLRMLFQQGGCFPPTPIRYLSTFTRLQIHAMVVLGLFVVYSLFTSFCRDTSFQARPFCRENALG